MIFKVLVQSPSSGFWDLSSRQKTGVGDRLQQAKIFHYTRSQFGILDLPCLLATRDLVRCSAKYLCRSGGDNHFVHAVQPALFFHRRYLAQSFLGGVADFSQYWI